MPSASLSCGRHEDAHGFLERGHDLGILDDLGEVRGADFLFAFADQHEVYRQLYFRLFESAQRAEECGLGAFLVDCATTDADSAQACLIDDLAFQRRRGPLGRIKLLHVVHEVNADSRRRARIDDSEDAGLAGGRYNLDIGEPSLASQLGHVLGALRIVAVLGRDGRQRDPLLQVLDVFVVHLGDLGQHRLHVSIAGGE